MKPSLLILAAGMGSRYGGLKQTDPVGPNGEAIIDYSIYDALKAGFGKIVFVIRESFADAFIDNFEDKLAGKIRTEYIFQSLEDLPVDINIPAGRTKPWGTGHAVWTARKHIDENFAVINADDYYGSNSYRTMEKYLQNISATDNKHYCMTGYPLQKTLSEHGSVSRGICKTDDENLLQSVTELTHIEKIDGKIIARKGDSILNLNGDEIVSMNFWGFTPGIFKELETSLKDFLQEKAQDMTAEFYLPSVVNRLIREKQYRVKVLPATDQWFGVTYPQDKALAVKHIQQLIQQGVYPENLWED